MNDFIAKAEKPAVVETAYAEPEQDTEVGSRDPCARSSAQRSGSGHPLRAAEEEVASADDALVPVIRTKTVKITKSNRAAEGRASRRAGRRRCRRSRGTGSRRAEGRSGDHRLHQVRRRPAG